MTELVVPLSAAVIMLLAVLGFVYRMRKFDETAASLGLKVGELDRVLRDVAKREDILGGDLRRNVESLKTTLQQLSGDINRAFTRAQQRGVDNPSAQPPLRPLREEPMPVAEDPVEKLLTIANRIVGQSSTTLEGFRESTGSLPLRISVWPDANESSPLAFIVEHRGSCYVVPNVVKPTCLPHEWFNRSEFGVNDQIQHVVSLPRLRRRGNDYDVQEAGVFSR